MGGDFAPENIIGGAKLALDSIRRIEKLYLTGPEAELRKLVDAHGLPAAKVEIVDAPEVVGMNESGAKAVRRKKQSSISIATDLVKDGRGRAAVMSAGNTGAAVAAATLKLRNLPGVERAGIASALAQRTRHLQHPRCWCQPRCQAGPPVRYAIMGSVYAQHVLGVDSPRIGLMSVGEEDEKGTELHPRGIRPAQAASNLANFIGNVEGHDLFEHQVDVMRLRRIHRQRRPQELRGHRQRHVQMAQAGTQPPTRSACSAQSSPRAHSGRSRTAQAHESYGGCPLLGRQRRLHHRPRIGSPAARHPNAIRIASRPSCHEVNPHIEEAIAIATQAPAEWKREHSTSPCQCLTTSIAPSPSPVPVATSRRRS